DGTAPADNPFFKVGAQMGGNVGANIQKIFSYGHRNGFGLAFDPKTGSLWESENGDDAFDEMNRITAGSNGGWVQIVGPAHRVDDFKQIETSFTPLQGNLPVNGNLPFSPIDPATFIPALQQVRWPPSLIADSPGQARDRLFELPGSHYEDPEFRWGWAVAPAGIGLAGRGLGPQHAGDLFVGAAGTFLDGGYLFEFKFDHSRQHFAFSDPGLKDRVDDNDYKFDEGQSTSLVAGKNFGIGTDIVTGPDGNLYVTSLSNGAVYMISRKGSAARSAVSGSTLGSDLLHDRPSEPARNSVPRDTSGTAGNDVSSLAGMSPESMSGGDTTLPGKSDGLDVDIPSSSSAGVFGGTTDPETPLTGDESDASAGDST